MQAMKAELFYPLQAVLGEGPLWDDRAQCLYCVDIEGRALNRFTLDGAHERYPMPSRIGTVGLTDGDDLIVALEDGLHFFSPDAKALTFFTSIEEGRPHNRGNDGKPDPAGNMWQGTMPMVQDAVGGLYRVSPAGEVTRFMDGLKCANGMGWSPDGSIMYFIDTPSKAVWAFDYDKETSGITNQRVIVNYEGAAASEGGPDGMTVDAEGKIWVAQWGGMQVARYDETSGEKLMRVDLPAQCVTCPTFGGENMDILFITTASFDREKNPHAGDVFCVRPGVAGMKANRFARA